MFFVALTFIAAFAIEGLGTLVSVIGLSTLFGANPIIIALAVALDLGKLVVVTLLYTYWKKLGALMKTYALIASTITMIITSAGAAGYLSGEFQKAMVGTQEVQLKVQVLKDQIAKYEERKKQIDAQIAALPEKTTVNQRIRLINAFKAEQQELQRKISEIDAQLPAMQVQQISVEAKAGPILYISKAFDISVEEAVKWVILMIIFVFDPLAVFLIIAGNFLLHQRKMHKDSAVADADLFEEERLEGRIKAAQEVFSEPAPAKVLQVPQEPATPEQIAQTFAPVVTEAPAPAPTQDPTPPIFEVLQPTPVTPQVLPEPAPIVVPEPEPAPEPAPVPAPAQEPQPPVEPTREVITREQLVPAAHFPAVSSLNAVKADDSVVFTSNPRSDATAFYKNQ